MRRHLLPVLALLLPLIHLASPTRAAAQDEGRLPPHVAERITALFNDPATLHFSGATRIPAGRTITGDVAVLGGPVTVAGRIEGSLVVINGDLELSEGAAVTGGVTVVGGTLTGTDAARVGGELAAYGEPVEYRRRGETIVLGPDHDEAGEDEARREDEEDGWVVERGPVRRPVRNGRADFIVATGQSYNRVEGLPITFGPVLETAGSNPFRLRAMGIYRTEAGAVLEPDRWGYEVRAEQFLGGRRALRLGAAAYSRIDPIEDWHVTKLENGLSTFFLHRDYRDHYEREGGSVYARFAPPASPLDVTLEYRGERHDAKAAGSPWTLFNNSDPWRPQPLAAEGTLHSLALSTRFDTRSDPDDPATGWLVEGEVEQGIDVDLERPAAFAVGTPGGPPAGTPVAGQEYGRFTHALIDARRYNRISPEARLNFRVLAGGTLGSGTLPPQRQHALGGEGSLPGFALFSVDCGARDRRLSRRTPDSVREDDPQFFAAYGCDRFVLGQVEYRGRLSFRVDLGDWDDDDADGEDFAGDAELRDEDFNADFGWVLFADAGRGWTRDPALADEPGSVDVGAGVLIGRLGVYAAVPVTHEGGINLFIRLNPRF